MNLDELINKAIIYDIELYKNCFLIGFYSLRKDKTIQYSIFQDINELKEIKKIIENRILVGFNNWNYDDAVLNHLLLNEDIDVKSLFIFSQTLIKGARNPYRYDSLFYSYDLLEIIREGFNIKSLKSVGVNLKYPKIQELPISIENDINEETFQELKSYNINDLLITKTVFDEVKPRIEMRLGLTDLWKIDVNSLSDSAIAKKVLNTKYIEKLKEKKVKFNWKEFKKNKTVRGNIHLKDVINEDINFQTQELKDYLDLLKTLTLIKTTSSSASDKYICKIPKITIGETIYTIALGGIHSEDKPSIFKSNEDYILLDVDVTSQYPSAILNNKICPAHLDSDIFLSIFLELVENRIENKRKYKETKNILYDTLQKGEKITVNAIYGLLNSKTFWLFDPLCTFKTTINNQLYILKLIDYLYLANHNVISANTDGILIYAKREKLEEIRTIYKLWEKESKFLLEESFYELYVRNDVNNYLAKYSDKDEIKTKGCFTPQGGILKGFDFPVIAIALENYFINNISPEETILNHKDIYDFCQSKKIGRDFKNVLEKTTRLIKFFNLKTNKVYKKSKHIDGCSSKEVIQNTVRYYVKNPKVIHVSEVGMFIEGYSLKKYMTINDNTKIDIDNPKTFRRYDYCSRRFIQIFNNFSYFENMEDYDIDYKFYIEKVNEMIRKIERTKS